MKHRANSPRLRHLATAAFFACAAGSFPVGAQTAATKAGNNTLNTSLNQLVPAAASSSTLSLLQSPAASPGLAINSQVSLATPVAASQNAANNALPAAIQFVSQNLSQNASGASLVAATTCADLSQLSVATAQNVQATMVSAGGVNPNTLGVNTAGNGVLSANPQASISTAQSVLALLGGASAASGASPLAPAVSAAQNNAASLNKAQALNQVPALNNNAATLNQAAAGSTLSAVNNAPAPASISALSTGLRINTAATASGAPQDPVTPGNLANLGTLPTGGNLGIFAIANAANNGGALSGAGNGNAAGLNQLISLTPGVFASAQPNSPAVLLALENNLAGGNKSLNDAISAVNLGAATVNKLISTPEPATYLSLACFLALGCWVKRRQQSSPTAGAAVTA
jgi:hypothetical protein